MGTKISFDGPPDVFVCVVSLFYDVMRCIFSTIANADENNSCFVLVCSCFVTVRITNGQT